MVITDVFPFIHGFAIVWVKDTCFPDEYPNMSAKCGLVDKEGKFILPPIYDNMQYHGGEYVMVNLGFEEHGDCEDSGLWGIVDLNNHFLIPYKYSDICCWEIGKTFSVEYQGKWGVVNLDDEIIIPFEYDWVSWSDDVGFIVAQKNKKYGCINMKGEIVIPFIYDDILLGKNDELIPVKYGDQAFYINREGHRVLF